MKIIVDLLILLASSLMAPAILQANPNPDLNFVFSNSRGDRASAIARCDQEGEATQQRLKAIGPSLVATSNLTTKLNPGEKTGDCIWIGDQLQCIDGQPFEIHTCTIHFKSMDLKLGFELDQMKEPITSELQCKARFKELQTEDTFASGWNHFQSGICILTKVSVVKN